MKLNPETIILKGTPNFVEGSASSEVKPGQHIVYGGANDYQAGAAASAGVLKVVTENDLVGKTIEDSYAAEEQVYAHVPAKGDVVYLRLPAGAAAITKGALIKRAASGNFAGGGVAADAVAEAEEAVDNSAGATDAFIKARII